MAFYISNKQILPTQRISPEYIPTLLEAKYGLKHRVFSPPHKFSKILMDSYEIVNRKDRELIYPVVPTGCVILFFLLGRNGRGELWGCNTVMKNLVVPPKMTAYCLRLRPGAFRLFSRVGASELTDQIVPVEQWIPTIERLYQPMRYAESFHERNIIVQRFIEKNHGADFHINDKIKKSIEYIQKYEGVLKINDLAEYVACTTRYLSRIFLQHVGIATKMYCQIFQLNISLQSILTVRPKSLLDTAIAFGYVDQAHMNRIYRKYLACTAYDMKNYGVKDMSRIEILMDAGSASAEPPSHYFLRATT